MTTRPELRLGSHLVPGLIAVVLFGVLTAVFVTAGFGDPAGFPDVSITEHIGYAMFNIEAGADMDVRGEGFLVAFLVIAVVLDAAIEGAIMLADRQDERSTRASDAQGETERPATADGGEASEARRATSDRGSEGGER